MEEFKAFFPNIEFGAGKWRSVGEITKNYGRKAMLTIDPYLDQNGFSDEIISNLGKANVDTVKYTDIVANPHCQKADEAGEIARKEKCDVVVAVGGAAPWISAKPLPLSQPIPESHGYTRKERITK